MDDLVLRKFYTTGMIANLLGVCPRTVALMIDKNKIVGFSLPSGERRVPRENLVRYLQSIRHESGLREIGE